MSLASLSHSYAITLSRWMYLCLTLVWSFPSRSYFSPSAKLLSNIKKKYLHLDTSSMHCFKPPITRALSTHVSRNPHTRLILLLLVDGCISLPPPFKHLSSVLFLVPPPETTALQQSKIPALQPSTYVPMKPPPCLQARTFKTNCGLNSQNIKKLMPYGKL